MDMDTAEKRSSTLDWDQPFQPGIPVPSLSDTPGKRQHGMWMYSGIASSADVVVPGPYCMIAAECYNGWQDGADMFSDQQDAAKIFPPGGAATDTFIPGSGAAGEPPYVTHP